MWKWEDKYRKDLKWLATSNENDPTDGSYFVLPNQTGAAVGIALQPKQGEWIMRYRDGDLKEVQLGNQGDEPTVIVRALAQALADLASATYEKDPGVAREYCLGVRTLAMVVGDAALVKGSKAFIASL